MTEAETGSKPVGADLTGGNMTERGTLKFQRKPDGWAWDWTPPTEINGRSVYESNDKNRGELPESNEIDKAGNSERCSKRVYDSLQQKGQPRENL